MNQWDRNNLQFLLTASTDTLRDWITKIDEDDLDYAFELLKMASAELDVKYMEQNDEVEDLTEAQSVLAKIMVM